MTQWIEVIKNNVNSKFINMKILLTNKINLIGIFIALLLYSIVYNSLIDDGVTRNLFQAIIAAFIFVCLYGIVFWIGFLVAILILDLILIVPNHKKLKLKLFVEWVIISVPIIYFSLIYERQRVIFVIAVIVFFITQLLREKLIQKAIV